MELISNDDIRDSKVPTIRVDFWCGNRIAGVKDGAIAKQNVRVLVSFDQALYYSEVLFPIVEPGAVEEGVLTFPAAYECQSIQFLYEESVQEQCLRRTIFWDRPPKHLQAIELSWYASESPVIFKGVFEGVYVGKLGEGPGIGFHSRLKRANSAVVKEKCAPLSPGRVWYVENADSSSEYEVEVKVTSATPGYPPSVSIIKRNVRGGSLCLDICSRYPQFGPVVTCDVIGERKI